ncbi:MAG: recombinase family protein [Actinomycetota bacterium]|nr:recombinase family protein [Actinomycetota bacterium]
MRRLIAYVHVPSVDATAPWRTADGARQIQAIEGWAAEHGARVTNVAVDRAASGLDAVVDRTGFDRAVTLVRDGEGDAIATASIDDLDEDMVMQELMLAEAASRHVAVVSASPEDRRVLAEPPEDVSRALVRRAIRELRQFEGAMRSLRAGAHRRVQAEDERSAAALAAFEAEQEHGETDGLPPGRNRLAWLLRKRRTGAP